MAGKLQAADTIRRLAVQLQGMNEAADILEAIGSSESAVAQAAADLEKAKNDLAATTDLLEQAKSNLLATRSEAARVLEQAQAKADAELLQAKTEAEATRVKAESDAHLLVDNAVAQAKGDIEASTEKAKAQLLDLVGQIQDASTKLGFLQQSADRATKVAAEAENRTAAAQANLDRIQAQLKKMAGL